MRVFWPSFTICVTEADRHDRAKHSGFSSSFPIYQFSQKTEDIPIEEPIADEAVPEVNEGDKDDDSAVVEEMTEEKDEEIKPPKTKSVLIDTWNHLNAAPPIWQRCFTLKNRDEWYTQLAFLETPKK